MGYRSDLVCEVSALSYDFETQTGKLDMAPSQCCDMVGCVELFEKIDADVKRIDTFAGGIPDTTYKRLPSGWNAVNLR